MEDLKDRLSIQNDVIDCKVSVKYKEPSNNQTYELTIYYDTAESIMQHRDIWGNVCLSVYSKRRDIISNERERKMTGKNPMLLLKFLKTAYPVLVKEFLEYCYEFNLPVRIRVAGSNEKRQKLYDRLLLPIGYTRIKDRSGGVEKLYTPEEVRKIVEEN